MNLSKIALLQAVTALTFAAGLRAADRPNVVFIVCDDLNTHVSTSGFPNIETPNFDQLAKAGTTFNRAYCQYPVCGPSRASFLHGLYPESTGVVSNIVDIRDIRPGTVSMPQAFKEQGYWTACTGKIFHNEKFDHGDVAWNEVVRFQNDEMPIEAEARRRFEEEHGPIGAPKNRKAWKEFLPTVAPQTRGQQPGYGRSGLADDQHKDAKNARQVEQWLDGKSYGDKPFFIALGIQKPHVPFLAPDAWFDMYPLDELVVTPPPSDLWEGLPKSAYVNRGKGFGFEKGVEDDALRREYIQSYHACVSFIDAQIGRVFSSLKKNGLWENTIVVLTSDHGYHLGEHFIWGKVTLFEIGDRVPLIVRAPGVSKGSTRSEALVELVDLFPTLAELCEVKPPSGLQGRSLLPQLRDPESKGREAAYTVVSRGDNLGKAVRTQRWRYARWKDGEELYDLEKDPEELHNLAGSPEHRSTLRSMRAELARVESSAKTQAVKLAEPASSR